MFAATTSIPAASKRMNEIVVMVRSFLRDFPELNRLIAGEETSDRMIAWAVADILSDYNGTPPFIGSVGLRNFPNMSMLKDGVVSQVLESVAILQTRNQLDYSDGGISVQVSNKGPMLLQFAQMFRNRYEQQKLRTKASLNIELAFDGGGVTSEYFIVNGIYFTV
jgi:hypothetical protein